MSGPRNCALPPASARFWYTSATSSRSAGIATSSSASPVSGSSYGDTTVRISSCRASTSEPSPTRVGRNGTRHAAACRPSRNMPSSSSSDSTAPACRALRKCGSKAIESNDTNAKTTLRTLPAAQSRPTSGPPYDTTVRSVTLVRNMARTTAIGLRRAPQPPIPIVMPSRSSPTISSTVVRLSGIARPLVTLVHEGIAGLVRHPGQVELEGEPLLEPVGPLHIDRVDPVERLLRRNDHATVERRDLPGDFERRIAQLLAGYDAKPGAVRVQLLRGRALGRVDHRAHPMLRDQPGKMRGRAKRALLHFW